MRMKLHFVKLTYFLIVLSSCSDMLSDYEKKDIYPLLIRYVPSYTKNVNWGENDDINFCFIESR